MLTPNVVASPLYQQIKMLIIKSLRTGEFKPGDVIPSELDLAARFQVSQGTVRKAIDELAADNILVRRQGKGTFVATHAEGAVRYRFLKLAPDVDTGVRPSSEASVLSCTIAPATAQQSAQLQVPEGAELFEIHRLIRLNQEPVILEYVWLRSEAFEGLTLDVLRHNKAPLYVFLEQEFGVSMVRAQERIKAVACSPEMAQVLNVNAGEPLLQVDRVSFTFGDVPMEIRRGFYLTHHYHYGNSLN